MTMASRPIRADSDPSVAAPVARHPVGTSLNAAALSPTTKALLSCGLLGSLLFTATYLIEGATRPGYDALQQAMSALSLGPGGWAQQVNFVVFGVLVLASAVGWRRALRGGRGAV